MKVAKIMGLLAVCAAAGSFGASAQVITRGDFRPKHVNVVDKRYDNWTTTDTAYVYNDKGKVIEKSWGSAYSSEKDEFAYNDNGYVETVTMTVTYNGGEEMVDRQTYTYDPKLTWLCTSIEVGTLYNGDWITDELPLRVITRNAKGDITCIEGITWNDYSQRVSIKYGADGKASEILVEDVEDEAYAPYMKYWDIEWLETDGQILPYEIFMPESFMTSNRFSHAMMIGYDTDSGEPVTYAVNMAYDSDGRGYKMTFGPDDKDMWSVYRRTDDNGSFIFNSLFPVEDDDFTMINRMTEELVCDAYGLPLSYKREDIYEANGVEVTEETERELLKGVVEYDSATGCPMTYTVSENEGDSTVMEETALYTFSEYTPVSGVKEVPAFEDDGETRYYDLQGRQVPASALHDGIFIRIKDGKAVKIMRR